MAIGAHQDDLEVFAMHGIQSCFARRDLWFCGIVCTDGAGSSRSGPYAEFSDREIADVRPKEQRKAAAIGEYGSMLQLGYSSAEIKDASLISPVEDLYSILEETRPRVVYLHNPADKHDTHIATLHRSLAALRRLPAELRPEKVYGCEVWRDLDWMVDADKVALPISAMPNLQSALIGVFDSQISGGKRYDLAIMGRRLAHATFHESHASDRETGLTFAMDLTPLVMDPGLSLKAFTLAHLDTLAKDISGRLDKFA